MVRFQAEVVREPGHLHAHGEGPDEPALERLLRDDPEVFVAEAVEQLRFNFNKQTQC